MNVRELFDYNLETGVLTWKHRPNMPKQWNVRYVGKQAGFGKPRKDGRRQVRINGQLYYTYRIVWEWVHGTIPPDTIDHINGDATDDRIANLRLATIAQNSQNSRSMGPWPKGVYQHSKKQGFVAQISCNGVWHYLGYFPTPEEAHEAYKKKSVELFGKFACWWR